MAERNKINIGSKVRDRAELGGEVIVMYGDAAKVRWNNGHETWIAGAWLRLDLGRLDETTSGELARRTDSRRRPAN